jgi:hypothetical protein
VRAFRGKRQNIMAKKQTQNKPKEIKVEPKAVVKAPAKRHEGDHMVRFLSNGLSRYLNKVNKIHNVTADHGQLLVDKGYGVILED